MELIDAAFPLLKGTNEWVAVAAGVLGPGLARRAPATPPPTWPCCASQAVEEIAKNLQAMKAILYGEGAVGPWGRGRPARRRPPC